MAVAESVLADLGLDPDQALLVFNKMDRLTHAEEAAFRQRIGALYPGRGVFVSAVERNGLEELEGRLLDALRARRPEVHVVIPFADGEALASVYREGEVIRREENGASVGLTARLPAATLGRLRQRDGVVVTPA
jgi:GTP-binding protein HflX